MAGIHGRCGVYCRDPPPGLSIPALKIRPRGVRHRDDVRIAAEHQSEDQVIGEPCLAPDLLGNRLEIKIVHDHQPRLAAARSAIWVDIYHQINVLAATIVRECQSPPDNVQYEYGRARDDDHLELSSLQEAWQLLGRPGRAKDVFKVATANQFVEKFEGHTGDPGGAAGELAGHVEQNAGHDCSIYGNAMKCTRTLFPNRGLRGS